jgi:hypothetical protein
MALLWASAACVLGCEGLTKERTAKEVTVLSAQVQSAATCEDCPLNSFPKAVGAQRLTLHCDAQVQLVNSSSSSLGLVIREASSFAPSVLEPTPLKRLPSLRI